MRRGYAAQWTIVLAVSAGAAGWIAFGRAAARRRFFPVPPIAESSRTSSRYLAVLLPRVGPRAERYAISPDELKSFLEGLRSEGYVSITLRDVQDLRSKGRLLPPRAILLAFGEDDVRGLTLADRVLRDVRMRAVDFIHGVASSDREDQRRLLSRHAVRQLARSGTWEFGRRSAREPAAYAAAGLNFSAGETGLNEADDAAGALRLLSLKADRPSRENLAIVERSWPRTEAFADDFSGDGLGADWVAGWGNVSIGRGRLALLQTPRQTGAAVFLRGTESWRDLVLEFELKKYQKEFWAYVRYDGDRYLRVGARDGYWCVEQKRGPGSLPSRLARAPISAGSLPARLRLVLKGDAALVLLDDRLLFGRAVRVHPSIRKGPVSFGVYDLRSRTALAVLTRVRAAPAGREWIAPGTGLSEESLDALRREAVFARAISPRWVSISADGGVTTTETHGPLIRTVAGFFGCRLVPMAELPGGAELGASGSDRVLARLEEAVRRLDAAGLNVRLSGSEAARPEVALLLSRLGGDLHAGGRELWVTVERRGIAGPAIRGVVDGVLRPEGRSKDGLDFLEASLNP